MDYESEQAMELEALEAILMDDMEEYDGNTPASWPAGLSKIYIVTIRPADAEGEEDAAAEVEMELLFAHTPTYPEAAPCIKLRSVKGLNDADLAEATGLLEQQIQENLGMAMVYNLVTAAQEWIGTRKTDMPAGAVDEAAEERRRRDEEEAKRTAARAHGTHVTVEAFTAWKKKFDAEMALQKAQLLESSKSAEDIKMQRLTGKQWFQKEEAAGAAAAEEEEALSSETEIDESELSSDERDERRGRQQDSDDDDEEDLDYEDDDDDGMLDEYLAAKN